MNRGTSRDHLLQHVLVICMFLSFISCSGMSSKSEPATSMFDRDDTVKNAYMTIMVNELDQVRDEIYKSLETFSCEVESENWYDKNKVSESISIGLKLPSSNFLSYIDYINGKYEVESLRMHARKTNPKSLGRNEIDSSGVVYSFIYLSIEKKIGYLDSLVIGKESASEALKMSLQSIIPVILFLIPYVLIFGVIITLVKIVKKEVKKKIGNK